MKLKNMKYKIFTFIVAIIMLIIPFNMSIFSLPAQNEGKYIITFKNENAKEKFVKDKTKNKKVKKNFGKQTSVAVDLTDSDIAELSASSDILYIESDSNIELLSIGKPEKTDKIVQQMKKQMFNTFNMGIGFVLAVEQGSVRQSLDFLNGMDYNAWEIGYIEKTPQNQESKGALRFAGD